MGQLKKRISSLKKKTHTCHIFSIIRWNWICRFTNSSVPSKSSIQWWTAIKSQCPLEFLRYGSGRAIETSLHSIAPLEWYQPRRNSKHWNASRQIFLDENYITIINSVFDHVIWDGVNLPECATSGPAMTPDPWCWRIESGGMDNFLCKV